VVNVNQDSIEESINGEKIDVIIEATGAMAALRSALPMLADRGRVVLLGYYEHIEIPYAPLFMHEAQILVAREWAFGPNGDLPRIRDMIARGDIDMEGLLTHRVPIDRVQAAYRLALEDPSCLKVVLKWPQEDM
jgi:3-hydroxyethyl bacteriochlorophyllide a dehydrogenase